MLSTMSEVTLLLGRVEQGDGLAAKQLLPLVYDELRKLAEQRMARENPGQTLQATALVHEAYLRLVDGGHGNGWNGRGQFFKAAAKAMQRILVDQARRKKAEKRGGNGQRVSLDSLDGDCNSNADEILDIDEALDRLARDEPDAAQLIRLRYFAGLSYEDAAEIVGISRSAAYAHWSYAKVRLKTLLDGK
jgi:RNA polymerase sigma factor (TIGR02999 family)